MRKFWMIALAALCMFFAGAAAACDNCGYGVAYYGGGEIYSCNEGRYDCRFESRAYLPRYDGCGNLCGGCGSSCYHRPRCTDGCRRACDHCEGAFERGFRQGFAMARYDGDDERGFYDGDHHWHDWQRWQDGDGHWRDGWRDDGGHWHDRDDGRGDGHVDGDHHDGQDGDHHDGDHHDGDHHDDHRDDHRDGR